jgi:glycosyltransferase involved in cell wall biosynthesis
MTPYRLPLWNALQRRLPGGVGVICLAETERNRMWSRWGETSFPVEVLDGVTLSLGHERHLHLRTGAPGILRSWHPKAVLVGGWDSIPYWTSLSAARRIGAHALVAVGSHSESSGGSVREVVRRRFLARADGVLAYGEAAARLVKAQGVPPQRVFPIGNPVDVAAAAASAAAFAASAEGRALGSTFDGPTFAFVGQLIARKSPLMLIDAFESLGEGTLLIVGDGPLRGAVEARAAVSPRVRYLGPKPAEEATALLGIVDCLVLPSAEEVWGLVVNEALAAGCLCVVSERAGAAELIVQDVNGQIVAPERVALEAALQDAARAIGRGIDRKAVAATAVQGGVDRTVDAIAAALTELDRLGVPGS